MSIHTLPESAVHTEKDIPRYDLVGDYDLSIAPISDGDYVLYTDALAAIVAEREKLKAQLLNVKEISRQLVVAQARIAELREALIIANVFDFKDDAVIKALSRTDDLSALQELKAGYEARIAELEDALTPNKAISMTAGYIAGIVADAKKAALLEAANYADAKGGCGLLPFELRRMAEGE